eukprot:6719574-Pyramimonas_sp.AAC.1
MSRRGSGGAGPADLVVGAGQRGAEAGLVRGGRVHLLRATGAGLPRQPLPAGRRRVRRHCRAGWRGLRRAAPLPLRQ